MKKRQLMYGVATFVPGVNAVFGRGGGDTKSARYCYSVWLRHLVTAMQDVMVRGKDPLSVLPEIGLLLGFAVVLSAIASWIFKWDSI